MPSQAQVKKDGLSVGDMQAKMMQKIEELPLYMIEVKQENEKMQRENLHLKGENAKLSEKLDKKEQE